MIMAMVLLKKVDPDTNMNRWYMVTVQPTLFDTVAVVYAWGSRTTGAQQVRAWPAESEAAAQELAGKLVERKLKRGYVVNHP
jgi:predicted DNA-binding WGR domain protein